MFLACQELFNTDSQTKLVKVRKLTQIEVPEHLSVSN